MKVIKTKKEIKVFIESVIENKQSIGFVPTMGALHQGHLNLIDRAVAENDISVVSIFVNPRQFNDKSDFEEYPRNFDKDIEALEKHGVSLLFLPDYDEIFENELSVNVNFDGLDESLEGAFRPGHFQGVVDVVDALFALVKPNKAYFGLKDFQQLLVIKTLVEQFHESIDIVECEIVREPDGLAMSSRNERLDLINRKIAANIYKILTEAVKMSKNKASKNEILSFVKLKFSEIKEFKLEYASICNKNNLEELSENASINDAVLLVAVWCGGVRLIDNIYLI
ncbi:MAG: pantoate--beta-alanine ligase [Bacteroidales bacterium]|nr:pantoate--beta-alanine ligase [Bacteroidales bacterium]